MIAPAIYTENLTINIRLKMIGSAAATTIIDGGGQATVLTIPGAKTYVSLSQLTIRNGYTAQGAGAGISNLGMLIINDSTVTANNNATYIADGGGIYNNGTLIVNRSTISANTAQRPSAGGGIANDGGTLMVNNSTITANQGFEGGAIAVYDGGEATFNNSTISGNTGPWGGGIYLYGGGATLQNSILAQNSGGNCSGTTTSEGYNLSDDNTCSFNGPGDLNNTEAKLGSLGYYGGPTQTIPEMLGSPTVDAGNPNGCTYGDGQPLRTDQRGYPRPGIHKSDQRCDMGAFERQTD